MREEDLTNLNDLTGRRLYEYRLWRKDDGDLNPVSLRTHLSTLRAFVRFCESSDAVESGTHEEILLPTLDANDDMKGERLDGERADEIPEYLERFESLFTPLISPYDNRVGYKSHNDKFPVNGLPADR